MIPSVPTSSNPSSEYASTHCFSGCVSQMLFLDAKMISQLFSYWSLIATGVGEVHTRGPPRPNQHSGGAVHDARCLLGDQ